MQLTETKTGTGTDIFHKIGTNTRIDFLILGSSINRPDPVNRELSNRLSTPSGVDWSTTRRNRRS